MCGSYYVYVIYFKAWNVLKGNSIYYDNILLLINSFYFSRVPQIIIDDS